MIKIPFEDGTKISNAKVTIDETDYIVTHAQYSGTTPLSAANLNLMQDNIEDAIAQIDYANQITPNTINVNLAANPQMLVKVGNLVFCRINFNLARDMTNMGSSFDTMLFTLPDAVCPSTNFRFVHSSSYPSGTDLIYFQASDKKIYCSGVKLGTSGTTFSIMGIWKV